MKRTGYDITKMTIADEVDSAVMREVNKEFFEDMQRCWEAQADAYLKNAVFGTCAAEPVEDSEPLTIEKLHELWAKIEKDFPFESTEARRRREVEEFMHPWRHLQYDWRKK